MHFHGFPASSFHCKAALPVQLLRGRVVTRHGQVRPDNAFPLCPGFQLRKERRADPGMTPAGADADHDIGCVGRSDIPPFAGHEKTDDLRPVRGGQQQVMMPE